MRSRVAPGFIGIAERAPVEMPSRSAGPVRSAVSTAVSSSCTSTWRERQWSRPGNSG